MKVRRFMVAALVLLVTLAVLLGCAAPAPAPTTPAPTTPAPTTPAPAPEPTAYENYVAGLQEGEFPVPCETYEQAVEEGKLYIYDWAEWWPAEIFEGFSEEFGIEVVRDHYASTQEIKTKFALYPETPFDLIIGIGIVSFVPLQDLGVLQQINHDWIPNVREYTPEELKEMDYDPDLNYSVSTDLYFYGYLYNTNLVDDPRIPSWAVLFEPADEYKGRITLWDNANETIGAVLKYLGYNWYSDDEAELMEARDLLLELKPHIMTYDSWPTLLLYGDEALISFLSYGDGWFVNAEYEAIVPALPAEGNKLGVDITCIPIGSPNPAAAHLFLNYLFRPEVNALLIQTIWYPPVHTAVPALLSAECLEKVAFPEGYLAKCDTFDPRSVTGRGLEQRTEIWEEMKS